MCCSVRSGWLVVLVVVVWPCWILTSPRPGQPGTTCHVSCTQSVLPASPATCQGAGSLRSHDFHNKILGLSSSSDLRPDLRPDLLSLFADNCPEARPGQSMQNPGGQTLQDRLLAARHSLAGQGLAKAVCKATTEEIIGPKKKHLDCE